MFTFFYTFLNYSLNQHHSLLKIQQYVFINKNYKYKPVLINSIIKIVCSSLKIIHRRQDQPPRHQHPYRQAPLAHQHPYRPMHRLRNQLTHQRLRLHVPFFRFSSIYIVFWLFLWFCVCWNSWADRCADTGTDTSASCSTGLCLQSMTVIVDCFIVFKHKLLLCNSAKRSFERRRRVWSVPRRLLQERLHVSSSRTRVSRRNRLSWSCCVQRRQRSLWFWRAKAELGCVSCSKRCVINKQTCFLNVFHTHFVDLCDAVEYCNHGSCPDDAKHTSDHICRPPRGACDFPEVCDGMITKTNNFFCLLKQF